MDECLEIQIQWRSLLSTMRVNQISTPMPPPALPFLLPSSLDQIFFSTVNSLTSFSPSPHQCPHLHPPTPCLRSPLTSAPQTAPAVCSGALGACSAGPIKSKTAYPCYGFSVEMSTYLTSPSSLCFLLALTPSSVFFWLHFGTSLTGLFLHHTTFFSIFSFLGFLHLCLTFSRHTLCASPCISHTHKLFSFPFGPLLHLNLFNLLWSVYGECS